MTRSLLAAAVVAAAVAPAPAADPPARRTPDRLWVYLGTFTGGGGKGIYRSSLDLKTGRLEAPELAAELTNPSWVLAHGVGGREHPGVVLYALSEVGGGKAVAYAVDPAAGTLTKKGEAETGGAGPCHAVVAHGLGPVLAVAHYSGGSTAFLLLAADGSPGEPRVFPHEGRGPNPARQAKPFAHGLADGGSGRVYCADLGADRVFCYRFDYQANRYERSERDGFALPPGSGPRHLALWAERGRPGTPPRQMAYVCNELNMTVSAADVSPWLSQPKVVQTLSTLPAGTAPAGGMSTAEVAVHPDGNFVYVSNRGHDTLAVFAVDTSEGNVGQLKPVGHVPVGPAKTPRHFAFDPTGKWLLVAGQDGDAVAVFAVDPATGLPKATGEVITVPRPVCVAFVPRP